MPKRRLVAVATLVPVVFPALALAQSQPASDRKGTVVEELVVEPPADRAGAIRGDVQPELQIDAAQIQSFGVSNVAELVAQLAPQTQSGRARTRGGMPVVLLNGGRLSGFSDLRDLPAEAILRVDVLPEEAALKYGYPADQRVLNFVTRKSFQALTGELDLEAASAGGTLTREIDAGLFRIEGDQRSQVRVDWSDTTAVTEDERTVPTGGSSAFFSPQGVILGRGPGGEIDPALSRLAGAVTLIAGLPATSAFRRPTLEEVAVLAGRVPDPDPGVFRTLTPETRKLAVNMVMARNASSGWTATLNGAFSLGRSESLLGRPAYALMIPAGGLWSPFAAPVDILRRDVARGPIRQATEDWSARLGFGLNGALSGWRLSLTGGLDLADRLGRTDGGTDTRSAQVRIVAQDPAFNPYDPGLSDLPPYTPDRTRSHTAGIEIQGLAAGTLAELPMGPVSLSTRIGASGNWLNSRSVRRETVREAELARTGFSGQSSLDVPILRREETGWGRLGDLSVNLNLQGESLSDAGALGAAGAGLNWSPVEGLSVLASFSRDQSSPSLLQLAAPKTVITGVRVFDYVRAETVEVVQVSGGDRTLRNDQRDSVRFGVSWKPFADRDLNVSANYTRSGADDPTSALPAATAEVQAAFPDRFVRDEIGRLVLVDIRPVNFRRSDREEIRWGFNWFGGAGPTSRRPGFGRPPAARSGGGGRSTLMGPPPGMGGRNGWQVSAYHTWTLADRILVGPDGPVFNLLEGSASSDRGGTPVDVIELQAGVFRQGRGARLTASWKAGTLVRGINRASDLAFSDLATVNIRLFDTFSGSTDLIRRWPLLKGARVTLAIDNLFDSRLKVRDSSGAVPASYAADVLDPVGRVVEVSFRKVF